MLILLFVVYQLWGTGICRGAGPAGPAQQFSADRVARTPTTPSDHRRRAATGPTDPRRRHVDGAGPDPGAAARASRLGKIGSPRSGVDKTIVRGRASTSSTGPGPLPETPLPGQKGNAAIAGHRTTYGAPFANVDELEAGRHDHGDDAARHVPLPASIEDHRAPTDVEVLAGQGRQPPHLTACHPKYSASQRIIVSGVLVGQPVARLPGQDRAAATGGRLAGGDEGRPAPANLDGETASKAPVYWWGAACTLVFLVAWGASRLIGRKRAAA